MKIILSLGSNVGDTRKSILAAVKELEMSFDSKAVLSRFYISPPFGPQDQDEFLNIALEIATSLKLAPLEVLKICKDIEGALGRKFRYHWGPREIDIDIIFIDDIEINTEELIIPHKEFRNRSFVLKPLQDLPSYEYYKNKFSIQDLINHDAKPV